MKQKRYFILFAALLMMIQGMCAQDLEGTGTKASPFMIQSATDWNTFASQVASGNDYQGKYLKLTADISVTTTVGSESNPFKGIFDGDGHKLTVTINSGSAPFSDIAGATIRNLAVTGTVKGGMHVGGLVGITRGSSNTIENCHISTAVTTTEGYAGGIIGHGRSDRSTLTGCLFDGSLTTTKASDSYAGSFVGWCDTGKNITISECVDMGTYNSFANTFICNVNAGGEVYTSTKNYTNMPKIGRIHAIKWADNEKAEITYEGLKSTYNVSGLQIYEHGFMLNGVRYASHHANVQFRAKAPSGSYISGFTVTNGTVDDFAVPYVITVGLPEDFSSEAGIQAYDVNVATKLSDNPWDGSGKQKDPYLITSVSDWNKLATMVASGSSFAGYYFKLTKDITLGNDDQMVGTSDVAFSGIFDGYGHTLTFNKTATTEYTAPFRYVKGATIKDLTTAGTINTEQKGVASLVAYLMGDTETVTTIDNCSSTAKITSSYSGSGHEGGFIGYISEHRGTVNVKNSNFTGMLNTTGLTTGMGGIVGYCEKNVTLNITNSNFLPTAGPGIFTTDTGAPFVNYSSTDAPTVSITNSHFSHRLGAGAATQGIPVFDSVVTRTQGSGETITVTFMDEPTLTVNNKKYYTDGTRVKFAYSGSRTFNHWAGTFCFITDPTNQDGIHYIADLISTPSIQMVSEPYAEDDDTRTIEGVVYTYLKAGNYSKYISDVTMANKGWEIDGHDIDSYLVVKDADGNTSKITAVTGFDKSDWSQESSGLAKGVKIINDLVGTWYGHTHLGVIAPRALKGVFTAESGLTSLYFSDSDANNYNALLPFDFVVGEEAFADNPALEQIAMMQYTTEGTNHWDVIKSGQVTYLSPSMLDGSSNCRITVGQSVYQSYFFDDNWKNFWNRIGIYENTSADMKVDGAVYTWFQNEAKTKYLRNNKENYDEIINSLIPYNATHKNFVPSDLLAKLEEDGNATIYYTKVTGADDDYLRNNDGVMRIYNDPGSYYNYKTLIVSNGAFAGSKELKKIHFYQTNGNSENSYSDLKILLENNIFKGCDNLKELALYYFVQDGTDHWESLGPEDVIPGNNLFGVPDYSDKNLSEEDLNRDIYPKDFRIVVSPNRYEAFMADVNWAPYSQFIVPEDYDWANKNPKTLNGLTYKYVAKEGVLPTDQVVTQDWSLWNIPILAVEVFMAYQAIAQMFTGAAAAGEAGAAVAENMNQPGVIAGGVFRPCAEATTSGQMTAALRTFVGQDIKAFGVQAGIHTAEWNELVSLGILSNEGIFQPIPVMGAYSLQTAKRACQILASIYQMSYPQNLAIVQGAVGNVAAGAAPSALMRNLLKAAGPMGDIMAIGMESLACLGNDAPSSALRKGMRDNILANHYTYTVGPMVWTPTKNLIYHTYVAQADASLTTAKILAGPDEDDARTIAIGKQVFQNHTALKTVEFWENPDVDNSREQSTFIITIPDSAFYGCTALETVDLRLKTESNGEQALGPDNFILLGDSIFNGCDTLKLKIIVPNDRKDDFLQNESWKPYARFFVFKDLDAKKQFSEYGVNYAYVYENGNAKKEHKVGSNTIEHLYAMGPDDDYIRKHEGGMAFYNDIGTWNNYQLDYAARKAFDGDTELKTVSFWDVNGLFITGDDYTYLDMTLNDSCFTNCPNLESVDLLFLVTDGDNHIDPMTPLMLKIGSGVFDNSPKVKLKMTEGQVDLFGADENWAAYSNLFYPCIVKSADDALVDALSNLRYYTPCKSWDDWSNGYWDGWLDLSRVHKLGGFSYLDGRLKGNTKIKSFPGFKQFGVVGLNYIGSSWFEGCTSLATITLPSTITVIQPSAFKGCTSLSDIDIPEGVTKINQSAFEGCTSLNTVRVLGTTPAELQENVFDKHNGLKIYVPDKALSDYVSKWAEYKDYIVGASDLKVKKHVVVKTEGTLAEELGLTIEEDSWGAYDSQLRYLHGNYCKYDSLTIEGPLNGLDLGVIRYLAGADVWESAPTDGCLRYLNLYGADIKKDSRHAYNCNGIDEYTEKDNWIGDYLFENCTSLKTVILPKSATEMGENIFEDASGLKRICIGDNLEKYDCDILQSLYKGIEEMVMLTKKAATSSYDDPWENPIQVTYVPQSVLGDYLGQAYLVKQTALKSVFNDDAVMYALAEKAQFFPSEYLKLDNVEGIFSDNTDIREFNEFSYFTKVTELENTFSGCSNLEKITLPDSIKNIGASAFSGCGKLMDIYVNTDSIPELENDAFEDLAENTNGLRNGFRIHVPKYLVYQYRAAWSQYADHIIGDGANSNDIYVVTVTEPNTLAQALGLKTTSNSTPEITSVTGDYTRYKRLKVIGPISGADFAVLNYMAGYTKWEGDNTTYPFGEINYSGCLEYLDLYEAEIKKSDFKTDYQMGTEAGNPHWWTTDRKVSEDNKLASYSFYKANKLKTLILPKTMTELGELALSGCTYLETVVLGDSLKKMNYDAFNDCIYLSKIYMMAKTKPSFTDDTEMTRVLCGEYTPSIDALYVRPSQLADYRADSDWNGSDRRTGEITAGEFDEDESFLAFARHAAATIDDLYGVDNVTDWFNGYDGITNLNPLRYTSIDSLRVADVDNLTQLKYISLPMSLTGIQEGTFAPATGLRYVDALLCADTLTHTLPNGGIQKVGITPNALVYVPSNYGTTKEHNVVVADNAFANLSCEYFDIIDGEDYCVPYMFNTKGAGLIRKMNSKGSWYSVCVPYVMDVPDGVRAYQLDGSSQYHDKVTFRRVRGTLQPFMPYIFVPDVNEASFASNKAQMMPVSSTAAGAEVEVLSYKLRGTLKKISNKDAAEMHAYVLQSDHKFHLVTKDNPNVYIPAYRHYFLISDNTHVNNLSIEMVEDDPNGIQYIETLEEDGTATYYDLNGRVLPGKPNKGVYIKGNKKMTTH